MNRFSSLGIKPEVSSFAGEKIKMDRIVNTTIIVHDFRVDKSKVKEGTKLLTLQIEREGIRNIIFSGSSVLLRMIEKVPKDKFPFSTIIKIEDKHYEFT